MVTIYELYQLLGQLCKCLPERCRQMRQETDQLRELIRHSTWFQADHLQAGEKSPMLQEELIIVCSRVAPGLVLQLQYVERHTALVSRRAWPAWPACLLPRFQLVSRDTWMCVYVHHTASYSRAGARYGLYRFQGGIRAKSR